MNLTFHSDWDEIKVYAFTRPKGRYFWSNKMDISDKETVPATVSAVALGEADLWALAKGGLVS